MPLRFSSPLSESKTENRLGIPIDSFNVTSSPDESMRSRFPIAVAGSALLAILGTCPAQEVASGIVGYNTIDCPGGSDTIVSVPFHRAIAFSGAIVGAPVINGGAATVTAAGMPAFTAGEFTTEKHYLRFTGNGARSGWNYPVSAHDATTITVDLDGDALAGVVDGDTFELIPYWTLATLFPKATQTAVHPSDGKLAARRKTRILFFDEIAGGISLAPDRAYFLTADGWFHSESGFAPSDHVVIAPGSCFVIRHPVGETSTTFHPHQVVVMGSHSAPLKTRDNGPQDNAVGLVRPIPVKLSDLDLGAAFASSASTDPADREDELLVYDNLQAAINKLPATIYFREGGVWRKDDSDTDALFPNADNDEISPATGLVVRKAATANGDTQRWVNTPRY